MEMTMSLSAGILNGEKSEGILTTGTFFLRRGLHHQVRGMLLILKLLWISILKIL
jgi:hypothetical protein